MGMDGVEFVMELEQEFQLSIPDADAERMTTVGSVVQWIAAHKGIQTQRACPTAQAFYRLRRLLTDTFDVARESVKPGGRLALIVPEPRHVELRDRLHGLGMRRFVRPMVDIDAGRWPGFRWLHLWLVLAGVASFLWLYFIGVHQFVFLFGLMAITFIWYGLTVWRERRTWRLPIPPLATVADAVHCLCPAGAVVSASNDQTFVADISRQVRELVAQQAGLKVEQISESTHFGRDLGW